MPTKNWTPARIARRKAWNAARYQRMRANWSDEQLDADRRQQRIRYYQNWDTRKEANRLRMRERRAREKPTRETAKAITRALKATSRWKTPKPGWSRRAEHATVWTDAASAYDDWLTALDTTEEMEP